jgi:hypothetical protein
MKKTIYRLGEYKIIESDTGQLMWEAHFGFGEFQKGQCFKKGSILFIGPAENCQNGFLKGEFLDDLKKYPKWSKTKYFGNGVDVHHCKNGKSVTKEEMMLWTLGRSLGEGVEIHNDAPKVFSNSASEGKVTENAAYRLQRYEIIVRAGGQIISRTYSGSNSVNSGNCFILENILFIGPQQNKPSNFNKRQFLANLRKLPIWEQTAYFSKRFSLHKCEPGNEVKEERIRLPYETNATKKYGAGNEYKNNSEAKVPIGAYRASFSTKLFAILGSVTDFTESRDEYDRLSHLRFIKSYISKSIAVFRESGIRILKKIIRSVALIYFITASLFVFTIVFFKKQHKKWNDRKK